MCVCVCVCVEEREERMEHTPNLPFFPLQNPDSETARKKAEADRLRAAEKFMVVGTGEATCGGCG